MKFVLASHNAGKLKEMQAILGAHGCTLAPQSDFNIASVAETGLSFVENALIKARHAAKQAGQPAIADDSGLCVDALQGQPGIYSARYAGEQAAPQAHIEKLLTAMNTIPDEARTAYFYCAIVCVQSEIDPTPMIAVGEWHGHILRAPQGSKGFGYDPIFQPRGYDCAAAMLSMEEKNKISHRSQALAHFLAQWNNGPCRT